MFADWSDYMVHQIVFGYPRGVEESLRFKYVYLISPRYVKHSDTQIMVGYRFLEGLRERSQFSISMRGWG